MKIKALLATATLVAAGSANALVDTTAATNGSEMVFTAWDPIAQVSYTQDLGVNYETMLANFSNAGYSLNFNVDPLYNTVFVGSNTADIVWNISTAQTLAFNADFSIDGGILATHSGAIASTGMGFSNLQNSLDKHTNYAQALHGTDNSAGNISYAGDTTNGAYAGDTGLWSNNWGGQGGSLNNTGNVGNTLDFFHLALDQDLTSAGYGDTVLARSEAIGDWVFNGSTIEYNTSVVPVPAAVWLLASGLIGFGTIARRRKNA